MSEVKKPVGRPRAEADEYQIEYLASIGCTLAEISAAVRVSVDTLSRNYAELIARGKEDGKASVRRMLFEHGKKGNSTALKYLIHNVLKERIEDVVEKDDTQLKVLIARLESLSTESILKLVRNDDVKKVG